MKHESVPSPRDLPGAFDDDEVLATFLTSIPPCPGIRHIDDDDANAADDAQALADLVAGRCLDHAVVGRWLLTAGDPDWKPFKEWFANQDG